MQDIDVINVDVIKSAIDGYNQAVASFGAESQEARDFYNQQVQLLEEYANGNVPLDPAAIRDFVDYIKTFGGTMDAQNNMMYNRAGVMAMDKFEKDLSDFEKSVGIVDVDAQEVRTEIEKIRIRSPYSDQNQFVLDRVAADVYLDMGIITPEEHEKSSQEETIDVLGKIPDLKGEQAVEFSERFIDKIVNNDSLFRMAPPTTLANAYNGTKERIAAGNGDNDALNNRLERLSARIDELSDNFAKYTGYYFADPTNIADAYDGYNYMFDARRADLDAQRDAEKIQQIDDNKKKLEDFIVEYDRQWGLDKVTPEDAKKLSKRWEELVERVGKVKLSDETLYLASKYKFVDANGNPIPQLLDKDGNKVFEHSRGAKLDPDGRLARVIDLARHDVAMQHVANVDEKINNKDLTREVNERIPYKLFEIDTADKIVRGAQENPEQFTNPKYREKFIDDLAKGEGEISDTGYQAAMDAQVNQTGGFCGRLKSKLKDGASKVGGLFGKIFKPLRDIDKRKDARTVSTTPDAKDNRKKRIDMFVRILKGFGSAFLVSAAITTIATAAAATAGISVAASLATIGVVTGIAMSTVQIVKWRKRQQAAGKPADITAFLKDGRMLATMGTTALASAAMIFGAAGLQQVALAMGYGALAMGGAMNSIEMYKDAKRQGFGNGEAITWAIANALAVLGGGIAGRMTANAAINAYNNSNPENTLFQRKETHHSTSTVERTETTTTYTDDAIKNAERIAKMWYADNPTELQHRVDMINAYNAEHGTNINPYRAIILNADAGGQTFDNMGLHVDGGGVTHTGGNHKVFTDFWGSEHGVSRDELSALRNMFTGDQINPDAVNAAMKVDGMVSSINEVGVVSAGDAPHYDGVLHQNTVDANGNPVFNTYANGDSVFQTTTQTIVDTVPVDVTTYTPVDVPWGLGMFGISYPRTNQEFEQLKDRVGALMDKVEERGQKGPEPQPAIVVKPKGKPVLPEHKGAKALPAHPEQGELPEHKGAKALPARKKMKALPEYVPETEEKEQILKITRAQAKKLDELPVRIAEIEEKRTSGMKKSQADKLWAMQKKLEQELQTLINKLGRPSDDELARAKAEAYRRYDLKNAIKDLEIIHSRQAGYEAHKNNRTHYEGEELARRQAELEEKIAALGGAESLDDTSYLYDPVPFKPEYPKKVKEDKKQPAQKKKKSMADRFRAAIDTVRDVAQDQFGIGEEFDKDLKRQSLTRAKLKAEYETDKRKQEKLRRMRMQQMLRGGKGNK